MTSATDNRTTELLNCPFCGDEASVIGDSESGYAAYCPECIDGGHTEVGWYGTKADAIEAWNTRYDPIDNARIVEVETSHIDVEQGEVITRFVPEQAIAATLGSGTLTAEQVMAIAGKHQPDYCSDTHVCFDWQAIADELNATLGIMEGGVK